MGFLENKKIFVTGMISERSIAYGIAKACHREGAKLSFGYAVDKLEARVRKLASQFESESVHHLDVQKEDEVKDVFAKLKEEWGELDGLVHAIAFAPSQGLEGNFIDNFDMEAFRVSQEVSAGSLPLLMREAAPLMKEKGGSVVALTYIGAERVIPHYNVMGLAKASLEAAIRYGAVALGENNIRCNGISAGPIRTLAAAGIQDFNKILDIVASQNALGRNITQEEVGNAAAFLLSDLASAITGQTIHVDAGFNIAGTPRDGFR